MQSVLSIVESASKFVSMNERFGALITQARMEHGLKAYVLAEQMGIKPSTLSRYENDKSVEAPPPDVLAKFATILGLSEERMLRALGYLSTVEPDAAPEPFPHDATKRQIVERLATLTASEAANVAAYVEFTLSLRTRTMSDVRI